MATDPPRIGSTAKTYIAYSGMSNKGNTTITTQRPTSATKGEATSAIPSSTNSGMATSKQEDSDNREGTTSDFGWYITV
jgi:hypothetical protein